MKSTNPKTKISMPNGTEKNALLNLTAPQPRREMKTMRDPNATTRMYWSNLGIIELGTAYIPDAG